MDAAGSTGLRRVLGPLDATCIVVGAVIGVGIFFTPSSIASQAGSAKMAMLAWAVGGVFALFGALTFAELGGSHSRSGAQYEILRDAYGPFVGFLFVFCNTTASLTGTSAIIAITCARHLGVVATGHAPSNAAMLLLAGVLILCLTTTNLIGVRWGASVQNVTVFAKVGTLFVVALAAALAGGGQPAGQAAAAATTGGSSGPTMTMFALLIATHFSYGGWQHALWTTGEIRNPQRNVPLAIIAGMVLVVVTYVLANWAYLSLLGLHGVAESRALAADAVAVVWPVRGKQVIAAAVALSAFGVLNAQLLSGPRLLYGMAADGRFFSPFKRISRRWATPYPSILLVGILSLVLMYVASIGRDAEGAQKAVDRLLTGVVLIDVVFYLLTGLAVIVLRRRRPDLPRPVRVPGYPFVPLVYVIGEIAVLIGTFSKWENVKVSLIGIGWLVAAAICYWVFFSKGTLEDTRRNGPTDDATRSSASRG